MVNIKIDKYFYLGLFFSIVQILVFIRNEMLSDPILFFHYCDNIALFLAIAFFIRNIPLIKALISTGLILQFIYFLDLIANLVFNIQITGSTDYISNYTIFPLIVTMFMHLGTAFVALAFVYKEKNKIISLLYAFIYVCFLYFTTILFTPEGYDINCIYNACNVSFIYFNGFTKYWIPFAFLLLVIPTHYLQNFIYHMNQKLNGKK
jgi:hypothetical protein